MAARWAGSAGLHSLHAAAACASRGDAALRAMRRDLGEPLLFKGTDLALTDIELVVEPDPRKRPSEVVARYGTAGP